MHMRSALHETANQVVRHQMDLKFFLNHLRGFAPKHIHLLEHLDLMKVQLDLPAFTVEFAYLLCGVFLGIG